MIKNVVILQQILCLILIHTMKFPEKNRDFGKKTKIIAVSKNHPKKAVEKLYHMEL